jgi:DNA-binding HxlR family transcriptional regulator
MVGKRWTGAILLVLMDGPLRFSEVRGLVPDLSDRLLSERLKELESEGIVERRVLDGAPVRVEYALTEKGRALEPAVRAL